MTKKIFSIIALLCMAVSGAWAQDEELLTTILNSSDKSFKSGSKTFDDKVTVTFSAAVSNDGDQWGWYSYDGVTLSVTPVQGYTITRCKFYCNSGNALDETKPFEAVLGDGGNHTFVNGSNIGDWGVTKIEVYGYESPAIVVTPTANKNEWTFTMPAYSAYVNVEYDTELALSEANDNTATLDEWDGYEADVTLTRTLTASGWNTFALPFSIDATKYTALQTVLSSQSITIAVKELSESTLKDGTLTLAFTNATEIKAGQPYLVRVSKDLNLASLQTALALLSLPNPFAGVEISKTLVPTETTYADFIPTLGKTKVTGDTKEILFIGSGNTLLYPTELPGYLNGFRGYFRLKGDAAAASSFSLNLGEETTGIKSIENGQLTIDNSEVYNLAGQRVAQPTKGLYIVNGKKVVIK